MTSRKDSGQAPKSSQLQPNRSHLHFAPQQPTIHRTHSLKQVDSSLPTFTPHINDLPFQIYPTRTKTEVSKLQLQERLIDNQREKAESLRAQRIGRQDQKWKDYCTFQPSINAESKKIVSKSANGKDAHQRLYEQGISKLKSQQEGSQFLTQSDKQNCTFRPNANKEPPTSQNQAILAPLYLRLQQIIGDKKAYLKKLEKQQYKSQDIRQKPQVSSNTQSILQSKQNFKKNVLDRLFSFMRDKNDKLEKMAEAKQEQLQQQCPFQPTVNYHTQAREEGDFLERQEKEAQKSRANMIHLQTINAEPFRPNINQVSALLIEAERAEESSEEQIARLYKMPFLERQAELQKIEEECFKECTFQPQINPLSKEVKGTPHQHRCNCKPQEEHYHFHPQINPKSREMAQKAKPKQKEEIPPSQLVRMQLEYREMKECTFRPKTVGDRFRSASQRTSLKNVKGAQNYSKRIEKVKARKKEEQQLKSKLFEIQKKYVSRKQTKAEPFKLSVGAPKLTKLKEQAQEQFRKQYTFKPDTANRVR